MKEGYPLKSKYSFFSFVYFAILAVLTHQHALLFSAIKMFASHKDDKKRIEKALETCDLPSGKVRRETPMAVMLILMPFPPE